MKSLNRSLSILALFAVVVFSCTKDDPQPVALTAVTFSDLAADPVTNTGGGPPPAGTKKFTLFSFKTGAIVANTDSASTKWDIGFNATTIIVNSGTSGPGAGGAIVQTGIFEDLVEAPATFRQDNKNAAATIDRYAISTGSGNGWYNYNGATMVISPIAGRVIMVKTADGKYAKFEILSYYQGAPSAPTSSSKDRYYTFRYMYQADGTTKLQ